MNLIALIVIVEAVLYILCANGFDAVRLTCKNYAESKPKGSYHES